MEDIRQAIQKLRHDYKVGALSESDVSPDPLRQFGLWLEQAVKAEAREPHAMTLATATASGTPAARIVLLRDFDLDGFRFFSNYESRKAGELAANPKAMLVFFWPELERQVRIEGVVSKVPQSVSAAYFSTRPRASQIAAWASPQSQPVGSRENLEALVRDVEARFSGQSEVPVPPFWGGYQVSPRRFEFWQGRQSRLHDRISYESGTNGAAWILRRLAP